MRLFQKHRLHQRQTHHHRQERSGRDSCDREARNPGHRFQQHQARSLRIRETRCPNLWYKTTNDDPNHLARSMPVFFGRLDTRVTMTRLGQFWQKVVAQGHSMKSPHRLLKVRLGPSGSPSSRYQISIHNGRHYPNIRQAKSHRVICPTMASITTSSTPLKKLLSLIRKRWTYAHQRSVVDAFVLLQRSWGIICPQRRDASTHHPWKARKRKLTDGAVLGLQSTWCRRSRLYHREYDQAAHAHTISHARRAINVPGNCFLYTKYTNANSHKRRRLISRAG